MARAQKQASIASRSDVGVMDYDVLEDTLIILTLSIDTQRFWKGQSLVELCTNTSGTH